MILGYADVKTIRVRCEGCGGYYEIPYSPVKSFQLLMLSFSRCSLCFMLREESSKYAPYPRCKLCNVPSKGDLCGAHRMVKWRNSKEKEELQQPPSVV